MIAHLDRLEFAPLPKPLAGSWQRPEIASLSQQIMMVPVSDSEILQLSHALPLVIEDHPDGMRVMALLHARFLARSVIGPAGQWLPGYAPVAIRALPFRRRHNAKGQIVAEMLRDQRISLQKETSPLASAEGGSSADVKALFRLADRLLTGRRRLEGAARILAAAGLLAEIHLPAEHLPDLGGNPIFAMDPDQFERLDPLQITALSEDALIGFELATAIEFSHRMLAPGLRRERREQRSRVPEPKTMPDLAPQGGFVALDVLLDGSELISFDRFQSASP